MNILVKHVKGVHVVQLNGELDMGRIDILNEHMEPYLIEKVSPGIIIDMGELLFVDSTGVGALLSICTQLNNLGTPFYIVNLTEDVAEVFDILGLSMATGEEHFKFRTAEEALTYLLME